MESRAGIQAWASDEEFCPLLTGTRRGKHIFSLWKQQEVSGGRFEMISEWSDGFEALSGRTWRCAVVSTAQSSHLACPLCRGLPMVFLGVHTWSSNGCLSHFSLGFIDVE